MNSILGKWIKKRNKSDFVVLILLGVMVMIVAMPTGAKQSQKETQTQEQKEQQLQRLSLQLTHLTPERRLQEYAEKLQNLWNMIQSSEKSVIIKSRKVSNGTKNRR